MLPRVSSSSKQGNNNPYVEWWSGILLDVDTSKHGGGLRIIVKLQDDNARSCYLNSGQIVKPRPASTSSPVSWIHKDSVVGFASEQNKTNQYPDAIFQEAALVAPMLQDEEDDSPTERTGSKTSVASRRRSSLDMMLQQLPSSQQRASELPPAMPTRQRTSSLDSSDRTTGSVSLESLLRDSLESSVSTSGFDQDFVLSGSSCATSIESSAAEPAIGWMRAAHLLRARSLDETYSASSRVSMTLGIFLDDHKKSPDNEDSPRIPNRRLSNSMRSIDGTEPYLRQQQQVVKSGGDYDDHSSVLSNSLSNKSSSEQQQSGLFLAPSESVSSSLSKLDPHNEQSSDEYEDDDDKNRIINRMRGHPHRSLAFIRQVTVVSILYGIQCATC